MPHVITRINDAEKQAWLAYCQSKGGSESDTLRQLIAAATQQPLTPRRKEPKSDKLSLRFKPKDFQAMAHRAQQEGFPSRSNWATQVLLATLYQLPVFTKAEMDALDDANRALAAIGRNLNQIAKVLNSDHRNQDLMTIEAVHTLTLQLEQHHRQVAALLCKGAHRWKAA